MVIEGGRIERGSGDTFRSNTIPEAYDFRALEEVMKDIFFQVYTELTVR